MEPTRTPEDLSALSPKAREGMAIALQKLARSDRFESEIRAALQAVSLDESAIAEVVTWLVKRGALDDVRLAKMWVARRSGKRSVGMHAMREELAARGASQEAIEAACDGGRFDEGEAMAQALQAKFTPEDNRTSAARFLLGRGFSEEEIEPALDTFFAKPA